MKKLAVNYAQWYLRQIIGQHNNRSLDNDCINYIRIFIISSIHLKFTSVYFAHIHLMIGLAFNWLFLDFISWLLLGDIPDIEK